MLLKKAQRGRYAGRQFYSCRRFPVCRQIINIEPIAQTDEKPSPSIEVPVEVRAAPRDKGTQSRFYQSCALPASFVTAAHEAELDRELLRAVSQWRLDFPYPKGHTLPAGLGEVIAVAEAMLTRGTLTFCLPEVEQFSARLFPGIAPSGSELLQALQRVALQPSCEFSSCDWDSDEEKIFEAWLNGEMHEFQSPWHVIPQIHLSCLSDRFDASTENRGDFLLTRLGHEPIMVEVDGKQHEEHRARDGSRDAVLRNSGISVMRVPANEVREASGPSLERIRDVLRSETVEDADESDLSLLIRCCKFSHQMQLALLEALRTGWLAPLKTCRLGVALPPLLQADDRLLMLLEVSIEQFTELLQRLGELYGQQLHIPMIELAVLDKAEVQCDIAIGTLDRSDDMSRLTPDAASFVISDMYLPIEVMAPLSPASPLTLTDISAEDAEWFLWYLFRKESFREGQWETIKRTLEGKDSVVLLPTGAGKSIAFQLAALLLPGRCIVVDPILSLIDDQIDNLSRAGIDRCIGITSELNQDDRARVLRAFSTGHYLFCYVAPERFQNRRFRESLRALTSVTPISVVAIDEAHCVSEWGHDFRTAYLNLGRVAREYCASWSVVPPIVALTGTASRVVLKDVQRELGIMEFDAIITPESFDREELHFTILRCHSSEKAQRVQGFLSRLPGEFGVTPANFFQPNGDRTFAGLIFCPHVNGDYGVVKQATHLTQTLNTDVGVYSGTVPRGVNSINWPTQKKTMAKRFKRNHTAVLACTSAFGMGIDKENIRYTVHIGLPDSIESFYQEVGRAGRNRKPAYCAVIVSNDDPRRAEELLSPNTSIEDVIRRVAETPRSDEDDIMRGLWLHKNSFRGRTEDVQDVRHAVQDLGGMRTRRDVKLVWNLPSGKGTDDEQRTRIEKALHRLVVIGALMDYTVDYATKEFGVTLSGATQDEIAASYGRYAAAYQRTLGEQEEAKALALRSDDHEAFVLGVASLLVEFVYQQIELSRRRAMGEMLSAVISSSNGEDLRKRILDYLQRSEFDDRLDELHGSSVGGLDALSPLLDDLVSPNDVVALRGSVARMLSSYPDLPGLLLLRGLTEALATDTDDAIVDQNILAALGFSFEKYRLSPSVVASATAQIAVAAAARETATERILSVVLQSEFIDREFLRGLVRHLPPNLAVIPARWLRIQLVRRSVEMRSIGGHV